MGERRPYKPEVTGSIPVPPTMECAFRVLLELLIQRIRVILFYGFNRPSEVMNPVLRFWFQSEISNLKSEIRWGA